MKNWQLNLLIVAYVAVYSSRVAAIKLVDDDYTPGKFRDLLLISILGILGEFFVVGLMYIYHCVKNPEQLHNQNIKFQSFLLPAACDFIETTILVFGLS